MADAKPKYHMVHFGTKVRVVETSTDLILRTFATRQEAVNFLTELDPKEKK